jgi:deoxyribodipyrimidine photo-lyase
MRAYSERREFPALAGIAGHAIREPWEMSTEEQRSAGVVIGRDYPAPLMEHAMARRFALELYGRVRSR